MNKTLVRLLLADDDKDDCDLFRDVLDELSEPLRLTTVHDGERLMQVLMNNVNDLPDVLFLDLNMPKKNGFECLSEIRQEPGFNKLPVIIFSTSFDKNIVRQLYSNGASFYIRKPNEFGKLKNAIQIALSVTQGPALENIPFENFVLSS